METCEYCGYPVPTECDGVLTLGTDPYQVEINDNFDESWACSGQRWDSAMEI